MGSGLVESGKQWHFLHQSSFRCLFAVAHGLAEIRFLKFDANGLASVQDRAVSLTADPKERGQYNLAGVAPKHAGAFDYVELERVAMFLIIMLSRTAVGERMVNADVIPKRIGISSPYPMRKAVFLLVAFHALEVVKLCWHLLLPSVSVKPGRVSNRNLVLAAPPKDQKLIGVGHAATGRVFAALAVGKAFHHGAVAHGKRFFPDKIPVRKSPSVALMSADNVTGEIDKRVTPTVSGGDVHAMHCGHAPGLGEAVKLLDAKLVMFKELVTVYAVGHVPLIAGVLIKPCEGRRIDRKINAFIRQSSHHFDAIAVINGISVFDYLVNFGVIHIFLLL